MNATPDYLDPARRAAVRNLLRQTVDESVAAAPAANRRRVVRFVSLATAVVLVAGGAGAAFALSRPAGQSGGTAVAPPATSEPASPATPSESVAPSPTVSLPAGVDPAGTATPVPTPTVDLADPSSWRITTAGVGPLTLGGTQTEQSATTSAAYAVTARGYACPVDFYTPRSAADPMLVTQAVTGDRIDTIMIGELGTPPTSASPTTPSGIGLGATRADLLATYPSIEKLSAFSGSGTPSSFGEMYGIQDAEGRWLTFELDEKAQVAMIGISYTQGVPSEFC